MLPMQGCADVNRQSHSGHVSALDGVREQPAGDVGQILVAGWR